MDTKNRVEAVIKSFEPSIDDPNGSYTGKPIKKGEKPVQDSDDL
jgi:hypothetical protein